MRFVAVVRADKRIGVLDVKQQKFAHFIEAEGQFATPRRRAEDAAARMEDGIDTTTGYVWEPA